MKANAALRSVHGLAVAATLGGHHVAARDHLKLLFLTHAAMHTYIMVSIWDTTKPQGLRERYERHHHVAYTEEALEAAVHLSHKYIADRHLPDKVRFPVVSVCHMLYGLSMQGPHPIPSRRLMQDAHAVTVRVAGGVGRRAPCLIQGRLAGQVPAMHGSRLS